MNRFETIVADAEQLSADQQWGAAALAWARAAAMATEAQSRESARMAWDKAGEAWRRDDRLDSAVRALKMALGLSDDPDAAVIAQIKLSGALGEMGRFAEAEALCRVAESKAPAGSPLRGLVLDTWSSNLLALGDKATARKLVSELAGLRGHAGVAGQFRLAQLARLDGDFADAARHLAAVTEAMAGDPRTRSGLAAAHAELGEVALLRGDVEDAVAFFREAFDGQQAAGRHVLKWRAEAARIRVMIASDVEPLMGGLDAGIRYAVERDMLVLEADLRIARGMALAARRPDVAGEDLEAAAAISDESKAPLRSGRARLEWASRLDGGVDRRLAVLGRAREQLAMSRPWVARVDLASARLLAMRDRAAALKLAAAAMAQFAAMHMRLDQERAAELMQRLA